MLTVSRPPLTARLRGNELRRIMDLRADVSSFSVMVIRVDKTVTVREPEK